ncbi:GTP-sensing pleiotropic transcriptional regulator CodY [Vagococcus penaei]|uniref:Global transcriptional regulator CodY n=1 Tax=Vagococcus penaei TaxID=633807 RepID=A0A1Q2D3K5_9ENTE|nr:GTP-sensing pleiotropic transcriptional regulator CodY [Vagococcus penaei]AQP52946.1 transcriptional repressor CodY [Vagococcus penaei]RSU02596.1 GTP-sensing pleiotropic transcriptional regulator CodY [Vagococcus penaei]
MESLLSKTRMINELLQREDMMIANSELPYSQMAATLGDILDCNVYIVDKKGSVKGFIVVHQVNNERVQQMLVAQQLPTEYIMNISLLTMTKENITMDSDITMFPIELRDDLPDAFTTIVPIYGAGERLGTIVLGRLGCSFESDDLVLAEYSATVVGMQLLYQQSRELEFEIRETTAVQMAISTLSFSELKAVKAIFDALEGTEGRLTASTIADQIGITRSVIVNALRKLESAGVIESRSLGMKGTYIKIINKYFKEELTCTELI